MSDVKGMNFQRIGVEYGETLTIVKGFAMVSTVCVFALRGLVVVRSGAIFKV